MLFMVIERFRENDMIPIYKRLRDTGRSLPEGLARLIHDGAKYWAAYRA
jgi:hypothetical protein